MENEDFGHLIFDFGPSTRVSLDNNCFFRFLTYETLIENIFYFMVAEA